MIFADGEFDEGYGREFAAGRFLPSGEAVAPRPVAAPRPAGHSVGIPASSQAE